jgi:hypothetical protein
MGWPKGVSRKGLKKGMSLDDLKEINLSSTTDTTVTDNSDSETEEDLGVITVNNDKTWGIVIEKSGYNVMVQQRTLYKKRTVNTYPSKEGGMAEKVYEAGEYGEWDKTNRSYFATVDGALNYIAQRMFKDKLRDAGDISQLAKIAKEIRTEIQIPVR